MNTEQTAVPITASELQKILRLHALWTQGEKGGKRADLRGANLRSADLYGADLSGANLRSADLYGADLRGANLRSADLYGADLRSADLYGADLRGANLRSADLYGANLRSADLSGANLRGANLRGANLRSADLRSADLIYIGQDIRGYLFWATKNEDDVVVIRAGCREFTGMAAAKEHWGSRHLEAAVLHEDCLSLITRCETMARVRGWKLQCEPATTTETVTGAA